MNLDALDNAVKVLARVVSNDPKYYEAHLQLGKVYIRRKWWDEALVELKKTEELNPDLAGNSFSLGPGLS